MTQRLSADMLRAMHAQETDMCPILLMTIEHPGLTAPILVSSDPTERISETAMDVIYGTKSRGKDYIFFPFTMTLPSDEDEGPQNMQLTFDNVTRDYMEVLRTIVGPPSITTEIVTVGGLDTVEAKWPEFLLKNATYDASIITGTILFDTQYQEPFPAHVFGPSYFSGLFR